MLFREKLNVEVPSEDVDIIEEGLLDSLGLVQLLLHIEQEFQVSVNLGDLEIDTFRTVRNISGFLESRLDSSRKG